MTDVKSVSRIRECDGKVVTFAFCKPLGDVSWALSVFSVESGFQCEVEAYH